MAYIACREARLEHLTSNLRHKNRRFLVPAYTKPGREKVSCAPPLSGRHYASQSAASSTDRSLEKGQTLYARQVSEIPVTRISGPADAVATSELPATIVEQFSIKQCASRDFSGILLTDCSKLARSIASFASVRQADSRMNAKGESAAPSRKAEIHAPAAMCSIYELAVSNVIDRMKGS